LIIESGRYHKKDQQQEDHVDQRREVDIDVFLGFAVIEIHRLA
jgi:hypothetical protein